MGWRRGKWEQDFIGRQSILSQHDTPIEAFLVSLTNRGAPKALESSELLGDRYFILARDWPMNKTESEIEQLTWAPIEPLFEKILALVRTSAASQGQ